MNSETAQVLLSFLLGVPGLLALLWTLRSRQARHNEQAKYTVWDEDEAPETTLHAPAAEPRAIWFFTAIIIVFTLLFVSPFVVMYLSMQPVRFH